MKEPSANNMRELRNVNMMTIKSHLETQMYAYLKVRAFAITEVMIVPYSDGWLVTYSRKYDRDVPWEKRVAYFYSTAYDYRTNVAELHCKFDVIC